MTFVRRDEIVALGRDMSRRFWRKFPALQRAQDPAVGIFTVIFRIPGLARAKVTLAATDCGLNVKGLVSKSACVNYMRTGSIFTFTAEDYPPDMFKFEVTAHSRAEVFRVEKEVKKLLRLHLYRSREARLSVV